VQTLAVAGELQRDLTYDGLRTVKAKGNKGGRRPAIAADKADAVRTGYLEAGPSPPLPATTTSTAEPSVPLSPAFCPCTSPTSCPGPEPARDPRDARQGCRLRPHCRTADTERTALDGGQAVRRGTGYTLRVPAAPAVHLRLLERCQILDGRGDPRPAQGPAANMRTASTPSSPTPGAE
jgi:hypothetical protein